MTRRIAVLVAVVALAAASLVAVPLAAQSNLLRRPADTDSAVPAIDQAGQEIQGAIVDDLPVDRIEDALLLQPGVSTDAAGRLVVRGGTAATYLDGIPVSPGARGVHGIELGTNAFAEARVLAGPTSARLGSGQSGIIALDSRSGDSSWTAGLRYGTDELSGAGSSLGFNRLQGSLGGAIGGRLRLFAAGVLQGQRSMSTGFGAREAPIFVAAGSDLTVAVPSIVGDPFADTTSVDIQRFAVYRGDCGEFSASANTDIASNYGMDCQGVRTPASAVSAQQWLGRADWDIAEGSQLSLLVAGSQNQARVFDYGFLYAPQNLAGERAASDVLALRWKQVFGRDRRSPVTLDAYLSRQSDRVTSGPLTLEGERGTRDPAMGMLVRPLDFLYDTDVFPVDDELVNNIRTNTGRRSPYDLEQADVYVPSQPYGRTNAYGLLGSDLIASRFAEVGGPGGWLSLYRERRTVAGAALAWPTGRTSGITVGAEQVRYDVDGYSHSLVSQAFNDVYRQQPRRTALFAEQTVRNGDLTTVIGLRYDRFDSRALRPVAPDSGNFYPRISSMPGFRADDPTALLKADEAHSALSPRLQVSYASGRTTTLRFGYARQAVIPDFGTLYSGINSDLSLTNSSMYWGTDLDLERWSLWELGVRHSVSSETSLDAAFYERRTSNPVVSRLTSLYDPLRRTRNDVRTYSHSDQDVRVRGLEVRIEQKLAGRLTGLLAYGWQDVQWRGAPSLFGVQSGFADAETRPHNFAATIASARSSFGAFLAFRWASGTSYTACPVGSSSEEVLSGELCNGNTIEGTPNGMRLPSQKTLDLRLTKSLGAGGQVTVFADARNLLNWRNVLRVFTVTNDIKDPLDSMRFAGAELRDMASEAGANNDVYGMEIFTADSAVDLTFGGAADPVGQCTNWTKADGSSAAPNCVYLLRAEERWGDGDHRYTKAEQLRAIDAFYATIRGEQQFTGSPRRIRVGMQVEF